MASCNLILVRRLLLETDAAIDGPSNIRHPLHIGETSMRIAKEDVDVKMEIPGAVIRQRTDFGDATGLGKISCEYFSLSAGVDTTSLFHGPAGGICPGPPSGFCFAG